MKKSRPSHTGEDGSSFAQERTLLVAFFHDAHRGCSDLQFLIGLDHKHIHL